MFVLLQSSSSKQRSGEDKHRKQNSIKDYISRSEKDHSSRRNSRSRSRSRERRRRRYSRTPSPKRSRYHNDQRSDEKENHRSRDKFNRGYSTSEDSDADVVITGDSSRKNNSVKSSINNAILQEMINVDDDDDEPTILNKEDVPHSNGPQHLDGGNESEVDIMDNTDSHDIKRELEHNLHKRTSETLISPSINNNNKSNSDEDNTSNHQQYKHSSSSDKKPKTKQAKRMLDILNKGIVKPEEDSTANVASTSTTSTSSALNKNSVAQTVVKYLTKYLHDKRIKDKVSSP